MKNKVRGKDLLKIGFPQNNSLNIALGTINRFHKKVSKESILLELKEILKAPENYKSKPQWGKLAESLIFPVKRHMHQLRSTRAPFNIFGEHEIDEKAKFQLYEALKLPIAVQGALMPDAHVGYGLPIGGVLATNNAVIPYGVGVDIGCRMSLSIFPLPSRMIKSEMQKLMVILRDHTKFGMHETHRYKNDHEIFYRDEFSQIPLLKQLKEKAYKQLGTSGGGNHFVEFGCVTISDQYNEWNLPEGEYLGLLSHSGSRGLGANISKHYTSLAMKECPLPKNMQHLAWLDLSTHDGQEYWMAMNLAADYAKACHDDIHQRISKLLNIDNVARVENHHNLAWKEMVNDQLCVVHRKGATPAYKGALGIIPGSMTAPGYIVRGLGNGQSLQSASHGAGRIHNRQACKVNFTQNDLKKELRLHDVVLLGGDVDEAPMAYKDINRVMQNQNELVEVVGKFSPKLVRMAY